MPGRNCAFPTCTVSFTKTHNFISLFKLPARKCDLDWKNEIVNVLTKYRVANKELNERIRAGN